MKNSTLFSMMAASVMLVGSLAHAQVSKDLDSLGSSSDVNKRASKIESRSRVAIVQNRLVKRDWRFEVVGNYGPVAAGDTYLRTQNLGGQVELHINPRFSLGVRYEKSFNDLTPAGKQLYDEARASKAAGRTDYLVPDVDYPEQQVLGTLTWYMMYGKINFFDLSVVQFDIYSLAGGGQMTLASGTTGTWTAGGGIAFWLTQHLSARFELRYQNYTDKVYTGSRNLDLIVGTFGLGVLL